MDAVHWTADHCRAGLRGFNGAWTMQHGPKVGCAFLMVVVCMLPLAEIELNGH